MKILEKKISDHFCTKVSNGTCNLTACFFLFREFVGITIFVTSFSQYAGIV